MNFNVLTSDDHCLSSATLPKFAKSFTFVYIWYVWYTPNDFHFCVYLVFLVHILPNLKYIRNNMLVALATSYSASLQTCAVALQPQYIVQVPHAQNPKDFVEWVVPVVRLSLRRSSKKQQLQNRQAPNPAGRVVLLYTPSDTIKLVLVGHVAHWLHNCPYSVC